MKLATLPKKLLRFWNLPRAERRDLLDAARALFRARLSVRRTPLGDLIQRERADGLPSLPLPDRPVSERVGLAVNRVANNLPFDATCLVRSLAIQNVFHSRGLDPGEIKVGVRMQDGAFEAHAWVVQDGRIVGDEPARVARFTEVSDLKAVRF